MGKRVEARVSHVGARVSHKNAADQSAAKAARAKVIRAATRFTIKLHREALKELERF